MVIKIEDERLHKDGCSTCYELSSDEIYEIVKSALLEDFWNDVDEEIRIRSQNPEVYNSYLKSELVYEVFESWFGFWDHMGTEEVWEEALKKFDSIYGDDFRFGMATKVLRNVEKLLEALDDGMPYYKVGDVCEKLNIIDWYRDILTKRDLEEIESFLKKAIDMGYDQYVCFRAGVRGSTSDMWAFKEMSDWDNQMPDESDYFRCSLQGSRFVEYFGHDVYSEDFGHDVYFGDVE